jgi:YfiH family protein
MPKLEPDWIVPDWPAPPGVRALCTTRAGGESQETGYASLNLGDHVGDDPAHVAANRARLADVIGARPVFLQQVHGSESLRLDLQTPDGACADASATGQPGLACAVLVADCLPVLLCDRAGTRVAAAHCGWRGLAGGVLEQVHASFWPPGHSQHERGAIENIANQGVIAWLGPCIGPTAFEVGPEVKAAFEAHDRQAGGCFRSSANSGKWLADLPALARQRLHALGVGGVYGNDGSAPWCTVGNPSRFFSYRRDGARSGRFAALVWRV